MEQNNRSQNRSWNISHGIDHESDHGIDYGIAQVFTHTFIGQPNRKAIQRVNYVMNNAGQSEM